MPLGTHVRRWNEERDWAEWDLEHPYVPKDTAGGFHPSTKGIAGMRPTNWTPAPGQSQEPSEPRVPTGEDLTKGLQTWNSNQYPAMEHTEREIEDHTSINPWNTKEGGSGFEDNRAQAAALMNAVADGKPSTDNLYRGAVISTKAVQGLNKGETVELPLAGFSEDKGAAESHSVGAISGDEIWGKTTPSNPDTELGVHQAGTSLGSSLVNKDVVYNLAPGAKTYDTGTGEHITAGSFRITGVNPNSQGSDGKYRTEISLEQTEPLTKPEGGFR